VISAVRLAFGLLTIFPVGSPGPPTRRTAGRAVAFFPLVGLVLGVLGAVVVKLVRASYHTYSLQLLPAAAALALLAFLSRGMHLDGLADVADGLGASRDRKRSLEVMKQSTIGAFGVVTVVFVVLIQAAALERCILFHRGSLAIVLSATVGRLAMVVACRRGIPAARTEGLGALVAGSIKRRWVAVVAALTAAAGVLGGKFDIDGGRTRLALHALLALLAALVVTEFLRWLWCRRLGGITGDVLGALNEIATAVVLLVLEGHLPGDINAFGSPVGTPRSRRRPDRACGRRHRRSDR
jgi:adenosylcobinamide-GDP ribazoletransferase